MQLREVMEVVTNLPVIPPYIHGPSHHVEHLKVTECLRQLHPRKARSGEIPFILCCQAQVCLKGWGWGSGFPIVDTYLFIYLFIYVKKDLNVSLRGISTVLALGLYHKRHRVLSHLSGVLRKPLLQNCSQSFPVCSLWGFWKC